MEFEVGHRYTVVRVSGTTWSIYADMVYVRSDPPGDPTGVGSHVFRQGPSNCTVMIPLDELDVAGTVSAQSDRNQWIATARRMLLLGLGRASGQRFSETVLGRGRDPDRDLRVRRSGAALGRLEAWVGGDPDAEPFLEELGAAVEWYDMGLPDVIGRAPYSEYLLAAGFEEELAEGSEAEWMQGLVDLLPRPLYDPWPDPDGPKTCNLCGREFPSYDWGRHVRKVHGV